MVFLYTPQTPSLTQLSNPTQVPGGFRSMKTPMRTVLLLFLSLTLLPGVVSAGWLGTDWSHRVQLTVRADQINPQATVSDVSLLVSLDADSLGAIFAGANSDGSDLVVTASDGVTVLGHELVSYDAIEQTGELWFLAPEVTDLKDTFYIYYGNAAATSAYAAGDGWTNRHIAVLHMDDDPATQVQNDSSSSNNFVTAGAGSDWISSDVAEGQIGQGWLFDGDVDWIDGDNISSADSSFTISGWFACFRRTNDANFAFGAESGFWHLSAIRNGGQPQPDYAGAGGFMRWDPVIADTLMHHFVWTLDGVNDTLYFHLDGEIQDGFAYAPNPPYKVYTGLNIQGNVSVGGPLWGQNNPYDIFDGILDEFRVKEGVDGTDHIQLEYRNQADPVAFWTSTVETRDVLVAVGPTGNFFSRLEVWPNPFRGVADIALDTVGGPVEVSVYDLAGRRVRQLLAPTGVEGALRLQWDGRDTMGQRVSSGVFFVRATSGTGQVATTKVMYVR